MFRRKFKIAMLFFLTTAFCFGQAGVLRDYVGLISINYHPDVVDYMKKFKESFEKKGLSDAAKSIDNYLKGLSGSGFIYVAPDGTCYILTNEHVVKQASSLSITFEKQDGSKTIYERLKVFFVDEEKDLALLSFDTGVKPFTQGLSFSTKPVDEGWDVFAAGFPGLGNTAIWQFSRGNISNAAARLPKSSDSDETIGPYIQHTAQIDPGNSGGPLLIAAQGAPAGYEVIGINTLSARWRQAANYAIPVDQVNDFIARALSTEPVNEREFITKKANDFIKGLQVNRAVYDHIAQFLSLGCTATNAEFAISELLEKATRSVLDDIAQTFSQDPVSGMNAAVAWLIENSMRSKSGSLKISLDSINPNDKGGFDVVFLVNDAPVKSEWLKEYGVYRLETYGEMVTGDKSLVTEKQKKKEQDKSLRTDLNFAIFGGYAYVLDYGSAFQAELRFSTPFTYGFDFLFGQKGYWHAGLNVGYAGAIRADKVGFLPFGELGASVIGSKEAKDKADFADFKFGFGLTVKAGLMFTTAAAPGLLFRVSYGHNFEFMNDYIPHHGMIGISIGYGM